MKHLAALFAGLAIYAAALPAQTSPSNVPDSHRPPPGMCRIWIDGVPPTHQPAPTDCATAIRKRPLNARVVFGSDAPAGSERTFAPMPTAPNNFAPQQHAPAHDAERRVSPQQPQQPEQRDDQERQRLEAQRQHEIQRQHDEQQKRDARSAPPPAPPQRAPEHSAPHRPRVEKTAPRPPQQSYSTRRHG